jgi:transposase
MLYHGFGLKGITYQATEYVGHWMVFRAQLNQSQHRCPQCGHGDVIFKGSKTRYLLMSPMGRKRCYLALEYHRIKCLRCNALRWPKLAFADGKHRFVTSFALTVLDLLRFGTIRSVAEYLGVSWDLIKDIHRSKLQRLYRTIALNKVEYIGIDEFSIRKGHHYMTIFVDLSSGRIVHAVEGKSKEAISPFLCSLKRKAKNLKAIAMDMSSGYFWAVSEILPHIPVIFDRYHVMALMNHALDEFRRHYQRQLDALDRKTLQGSRFLLLRNYESLEQDGRARLEQLLQVNEPLYIMHSMKEQFRIFWEKQDEASAERFLETWCRDATASGIRHLAKVAKTLAGYRTGLLNYFHHRITNGPLEGLVNKIKTLKRQAYGFRDMDYFRLRLYHLHTQRYSLTG